MDNAFLVSTESLFQATTRLVTWSAAMSASKANNDAAGEKIQSSTKPVKAPIENPPTTVINRTCFLKFKHKTSIAMDFISSCNVELIYDLSFKKFYLGLDVGRGRDDVGRTAGLDGLPQAPQALMFVFISLIFMGFRKRILIDCKSHKYHQYA